MPTDGCAYNTTQISVHQLKKQRRSGISKKSLVHINSSLDVRSSSFQLPMHYYTVYNNILSNFSTAEASGSTSYATAGASAAAHAHWAARNAAAGPGKYSNGVVAAVVAAPLFLLGLWMQRKSQSPYLKSGFSTRPDGLLNPPVNEYLREDLRPRTHSRSSFWSKGWNGGSSRKEMGSPLKKTAAAAAAAVTPS